MSKGIRRPTVRSAFEAKNVIVAACAAIAMVLGAMSVSTTVSTSEPGQAGEVSAIINSDTVKQKKPANSSGFSRKHTLEVRNFLQQQGAPLYSDQKSTGKAHKSLPPVFGTVSPIFFINQLTQPAQTPAQTSSTTPDDSSKGETTAPPASETPGDTTGDGTAATPPPEDKVEPEPTTPADGSSEQMTTFSQESATAE